MNKKAYDLKEIEIQMINVLYNQYMATLSNFFSFIALERLAYPVTQNTKFNLTDQKLEIWDEEPEKTGKAIK